MPRKIPRNPSMMLRAMQDCRIQKWIQSRDAGHDLGEDFVIRWFRENWRRWYRQRWVEHALGQVKYEEFDDVLFGHAKRMKYDTKLVENILSQLANMGENLMIVVGAARSLPRNASFEDVKNQVNLVKAILNELNINEYRPTLSEDEIRIGMLAYDEADRYKWNESQKAGRDLGPEYLIRWIQEHGPEFLARIQKTE